MLYLYDEDLSADLSFYIIVEQEKELKAIDGVVGAERSKYQRKKK